MLSKAQKSLKVADSFHLSQCIEWRIFSISYDGCNKRSGIYKC